MRGGARRGGEAVWGGAVQPPRPTPYDVVATNRSALSRVLVW
jgi:hypothetical protein